MTQSENGDRSTARLVRDVIASSSQLPSGHCPANFYFVRVPRPAAQSCTGFHFQQLNLELPVTEVDSAGHSSSPA
jgi:hypothetical protein